MKSLHTSTTLVLALLISTSLSVSVPRVAHAIPVVDAGNIAQSTISAITNTITSIMEIYSKIKDSVLDPIAWIVSKVEINLESTKILQGIQGGGGGGRREGGDTLFVHDWKNFTDVLRTDELAFFQKELEGTGKINPAFKDALSFSFNNIGKSQNDVFKNLKSTFETDFNGSLDNFYNDFGFGESNGMSGWEAWKSVVTDPSNNPYLSYLELNDARIIRAQEAIDALKNEAIAGQGFLGSQDCEKRQSSESDDLMSSTAQDCDTTRPGVTVGTDLSQVLQQSITTLGYADELSEILSSAISQLTAGLRTKGVARANNQNSPTKPVVEEERKRTFQESKDNAVKETKRAQERVNEVIENLETVWQLKARSLEAIDEFNPGLIFSIGRIIDLSKPNAVPPDPAYPALGKCERFPDIYENARVALGDALRRKEALEKEVGYPVYAEEMGTTGDPWSPGNFTHLQPIGTLEEGGRVSQRLAAAHAELSFLTAVLENPDEIPSNVVSPELRYAFEKPRPDGEPQNAEDRFREARRRADVTIGSLEGLLLEVPQPEIANAEYRRILGERNNTDSDWRRCYQ